jgi:hypothetical protein
LTWYQLRHPVRHDQVFGEQIGDERGALRRAARLADFYQHPIEVCEVVDGRRVRPVAAPVPPGPTVPIE